MRLPLDGRPHLLPKPARCNPRRALSFAQTKAGPNHSPLRAGPARRAWASTAPLWTTHSDFLRVARPMTFSSFCKFPLRAVGLMSCLLNPSSRLFDRRESIYRDTISAALHDRLGDAHVGAPRPATLREITSAGRTFLPHPGESSPMFTAIPRSQLNLIRDTPQFVGYHLSRPGR